MQTIRAKFVCTSVEKSRRYNRPGEFLYTAKFHPVTSGSVENQSFFDSTPCGQLEIGTMRDDHFEPGASYYLDFTRADD